MKLINCLLLNFVIIILCDLIVCDSKNLFETEEDILKFEEQAFNRIQKGELKNIDIEKIPFYFHNTSATDFVSFTATKIETIFQQDFYDATKNILFMFPGRNTPHDNPNVMAIVNHNVNSHKYNVIYIDIIYYSPDTYSVIINARSIGRALSIFLKKLMNDYQVPPDRIEIHGYSIGAVVAAEAARVTTPKVGLAVFVDPFRCGGFCHRGYAQYTLAIRTDAEYNGDTVWDSDTEIIVNNGKREQPGCEVKPPEEGCSHVISLSIWGFMISNPELFYGVECNEMRCNYSSIVSNIGPDFRRKGTFYLRTLSHAPYGMGLEGIKNIIPTRNTTFTNKDFYIYETYIPANYDMCYNLG